MSLPPPEMPGARSDLVKLAAECHRAKWQFDYNDESRPSAALARTLLRRAFDELHRIGDLARKMYDEAKIVPAAEEKPRVPKVRTSHHRNKEEAARLQSLVDERYASSPFPAAQVPLAWIANDPEGGPYLTYSEQAARNYPNPTPLYAHPPSPAAGITPEMRAAIQRGCDEVNASISAAEAQIDWKELYEQAEADNKAMHASLVEAARRSPAGHADEVDKLIEINSRKDDELARLLREIERLRAALSWMEDQDPQMVEAARERFSLPSTARGAT